MKKRTSVSIYRDRHAQIKQRASRWERAIVEETDRLLQIGLAIDDRPKLIRVHNILEQRYGWPRYDMIGFIDIALEYLIALMDYLTADGKKLVAPTPPT